MVAALPFPKIAHEFLCAIRQSVANAEETLKADRWDSRRSGVRSFEI
jgi:hypothetical protein